MQQCSLQTRKCFKKLHAHCEKSVLHDTCFIIIYFAYDQIVNIVYLVLLFLKYVIGLGE